jgi:hypothetical protein
MKETRKIVAVSQKFNRRAIWPRETPDLWQTKYVISWIAFDFTGNWNRPALIDLE